MRPNSTQYASSPLSFYNIAGLPQKFYGEIADDLFEARFDVLIYFDVLYVLLVCYGPKFMESRKPLNLRPIAAVWNFLLSLFSFAGFLGTSTILLYLLHDGGFYRTVCFFDHSINYEGELVFWIFAFLLSKIPEAIDTVLLVLQKKPIIFLHWFHHLTVTIFCWYAGASLIPSGIFFATMNYFVHSIMYFYYFLCSLGLRNVIRPIAPLITGAQLLQMVIGTSLVLYTFYYNYISPYGCNVARRTIRMGLVMYGSYFLLFAILFSRLYIRKKVPEARMKCNGEKRPAKPGVDATLRQHQKEIEMEA